jgi:hypothetical protein
MYNAVAEDLEAWRGLHMVSYDASGRGLFVYR